MSRIRSLATALALSVPLFAASSTASAGGTAHLAVAGINEKAAFEMSFGYLASAKGFYVAPSVGFDISAAEESDDRYYTQTQKNGTEVCRDSTNGRYAEKSNCGSDAEFRAFAALEAGYRIKNAVALGVGVRVSEETVPYAVANIGGLGRANFRVAVGKDYGSLGVSFGF